jgi:hypothetical protein
MSTGDGTVTPIAPGPAGPSTFEIAEALPYTLLSRPRFAMYLGINPVHFQGGVGQTVFPLGSNACNDLWPRHSWQASDRVSHEDLAYAIQDAETEIAKVLGYWPAPVWVAQETHPFPHHYRQDVWRYGGTDVTLRRISVQTKFGNVIAGGQRAVELIGSASVADGSLVYSDADSDGYIERATVSMTTSITNVCQLKVYFAGTAGNQAWEIRPVRTKSVSGGAVTFVFPSWLFIDPDIQSRYPTTDGFLGIDLTTTANFVTSVDVYREYHDPTATNVTFFWEPEPQTLLGFCSTCGGSGCTACQLTTQNGCISVRDVEQGIVGLTPATYNESTGLWQSNCFTVCRNPDELSLYYYAGELDNLNLRGDTCRELKGRLGRAIAWLATARLERPFCNCQVVTAMATDLRRDLALSGEESFQITEDDLSNPFGTRRGEILAWRYVQNIASHSIKGFAI